MTPLCGGVSRTSCDCEALACLSEAGKGRHQLVTGRSPAGSSRNYAAYESATGYPAYTTAFSPSLGCRVFCDTGEPVEVRDQKLEGKIEDLERTGQTLSLGSYRLIDTTDNRGYFH